MLRGKQSMRNLKHIALTNRNRVQIRWMSNAVSLENMSMEVKGDGVAVIKLDAKGAKVNSLNQSLMGDFTTMFNTVKNDSSIKSVVLMSGKPGTFIAGADINMLSTCKTEEDAYQMSRRGHEINDQLEKSTKPIICAIDGDCLGGGLEVALACQYRIASSNPKTKLGLVESLIGLLPGAGGTQRLPKLVGIQESLTMMTAGKKVVPAKAKKIGLVDQVCDPAALEYAAIQAAEEIACGTRKLKKKQKSLFNRILEDTPLRSVVFSKAKEMVEKRTKGNYPQLPAIIKCVEAGVNGDKGYEVEAREFAKLVMSPVSKALINTVFHGMNSLKKNRFGNEFHEVNTVGVLGAGLMGAGIAQVTAVKGIRSWMKDRDVEALTRGNKQIKGNFDTKVKRRAMTAYKRDQVMSNILGFTDSDLDSFAKHVKKTDMLIEAVPENLDLKHKVIKSIEEMGLPDHAVFASNTSAIPIAEIAKGSKKPERVIGMHYFSPVDKMPLLEVIPHDGTSNETKASAVAMGIKQGKTVIIVKDVPGFYVNRCLGPVIVETCALLADDIKMEQLNSALTKFGMPVGPISLFDEVGMDVGYHVADYLSQSMGVRMSGGDISLMKKMIDANMLGKKTGKGFLMYGKGKKGTNPDALKIVEEFKAGRPSLKLADEDIAFRLMSRFMNEAALCLQDGIIENPVDGDVGAVFGIGFPPFLGGPFSFVDNYGSSKFVEEMNKLASKYGPQFEPCDLLKKMAKTNEKFHKNRN